MRPKSWSPAVAALDGKQPGTLRRMHQRWSPPHNDTTAYSEMPAANVIVDGRLIVRGDGTESLAVASDKILVGIAVRNKDQHKEMQRLPFRLQVLGLADGKQQQELPLPAKPILGGISAAAGRVYVTTRVNGENTPADFGKLVRILRDAKFAGPLIIEYEEKEDPFEAIPRYIKQLREVLNG